MIEELHALTNGRMMGRVLWDRRRDRLSFIYEEEWRKDAESHPLSLSMPLTAAEHGHKVVDPFLWGLLPDNDGILKSWGRRFQVSPRHAFQLLFHVGEECAGAVQLARPEHAAKWLHGTERGTIKWMKDDEIIKRMHLLLKDHSAVRTGADAGQFSLAGAQPKTGFFYDQKRKRWGVPSGMIPTTHIFKPATGKFDGHAENEHFCINLARELEIPAASSEIRYFGGAAVIVIERFDRMRNGAEVKRIHQEDVCQALARKPQLKYQDQGGPSPKEIINLIREHSSNRKEDENRFVDSLILNWLIFGTDSHAKNYSLLIAPGQIRLAPLYDLASAVPYPHQIQPRKARLAMKIGNQYKLMSIGMREWKKCASELRIDFSALHARILHLTEKLPDAAWKVEQKIKNSGIKHNVIDRLAEALADRSEKCKASMN
ncbi:MAG: type II toxin-antitoxin system HipA family toxin [Verrucomicrobiae bacterium]|nr:type II toxin-antitoxin system HipA family toxin [Verrucomicrobiae bacterium]